MNVGRDRAMELRSYHGIRGIASDEQIDGMVVNCGLILGEDAQLVRGIPEALIDGVLMLRRGLSRPWRRWLKCHALGHHLLHEGNQLRRPRVVRAKWEHQANDFAGGLILGALPFPSSEGVAVSRVLAEWADVPAECVDRWLHSAHTEQRTAAIMRAGSSR